MAPLTKWILLMCSALAGQGSAALDCGRAPLNSAAERSSGSNATSGSWPWQASLQLSFLKGHVCGGTLINNQWILTAAHCITVHLPAAWVVYLGRETQDGYNFYEVKRTVSKIIIHPHYNTAILDNDIALMKLSGPVSFTNHIRPICLASNSSHFHNSTSCWATGWGQHNDYDAMPDLSPLQQAQVPVIVNMECNCSYSQSNKSITENMICTGPEKKFACQGYSGGPLQCKQGSVWIQAGIASFGPNCTLADYPEVYTRVSQFQKWINDQVARASVGFVMFTSNGTDPDSSFLCPNSSATNTPNVLVLVVISLIVAQTL